MAFLVHDDGSAEPATADVLGPGPATQALPVPTTQTASDIGPAAPGRRADGNPGGRGQPTSSPTSTAAQAPPTTNPDAYTYPVTLEPSCARVGEEFTLTIRVGPWFNVGIAAMYADGDSHGTLHATTAGEDGVVVHTWRAPAAPGDAVLVTGATEPGPGRQGGTRVDFRVVEVTDTC